MGERRSRPFGELAARARVRPTSERECAFACIPVKAEGVMFSGKRCLPLAALQNSTGLVFWSSLARSDFVREEKLGRRYYELEVGPRGRGGIRGNRPMRLWGLSSSI